MTTVFFNKMFINIYNIFLVIVQMCDIMNV